MSTPTSSPNPRSNTQSKVELGVVALSTLVTVGVVVLFLALMGARPKPLPPQHASDHAPLIQQPATEARPSSSHPSRSTATTS